MKTSSHTGESGLRGRIIQSNLTQGAPAHTITSIKYIFSDLDVPFCFSCHVSHLAMCAVMYSRGYVIACGQAEWRLAKQVNYVSARSSLVAEGSRLFLPRLPPVLLSLHKAAVVMFFSPLSQLTSEAGQGASSEPFR